MNGPFEKERREFVRIPCAIPVRYKFLSDTRSDPELDQVYEGNTSNLSAGGFLLSGPLPRKEWIPDLLLQKIVVGVNLWIQGSSEPIRALARLVWIEAADEKVVRCFMGVSFKEMTTGDQDKIIKFIVQSRFTL